MNWGNSRQSTPVRGVWRAFCAALLGFLCLCAAPSAFAQNIATTSGTARAVIVAPLTLIKDYDMSFGKILPSAAAGTVTIDPGTNACQPSAGLMSFGICRAAQFAGMGTKNMTARITMSGISSLTGPGAAMTVDTFIVGKNSSISFQGNTNGNGNGNGLLNGNGNQKYKIDSATGIFIFTIGATLRVNANQAPGVYNGTFSVTVQYN